MRIETVETNPDHTSHSPVGDWSVVTPVGEPPRRFYRQVFYLRFNTGLAIDNLAIQIVSTEFAAEFRSLVYDAIDPDESALEAEVHDDDGCVIVQLNAPRRIWRIRLSRAGNGLHGRRLGLYRVDGNKISDEPTTSARVSRRHVTFREDFSDVRFALKTMGTDASDLRGSDLGELLVRSAPTGPRVGIADANDASRVPFFWPTPEQIADTRTTALFELDAGQALAESLQRYLDSLSISDEEEVQAALVIESDSPCQLRIHSLSVEYRLVSTSFDTSADKQTLRYSPQESSSHVLKLRLPSDANVSSAQLDAVASFAADRPLPNGNGENGSAPPTTRTEGVHLGAGRWVAQSIELPTSISISSLSLHLMATRHDTQLAVELREDVDGKPKGSKLDEGSITIARAGKFVWFTIPLPAPRVIRSGSLWIVVKAEEGEAVWLTQQHAAAGDLLTASEPFAVAHDFHLHQDRRAEYRFLSRLENLQGKCPFSVSVGEHEISGGSSAADSWRFELASALNTALADATADAGFASIPLVFTSQTSGILTVNPPRIEYEI